MKHVTLLTLPMMQTLTDKNLLHKYAMALLPQQGLGPSPRAEAGFQFRVDAPGDVLGESEGVVFTWRSRDHDRVEVTAGDHLTLMFRVAAVSRQDGKRETAWPDSTAWIKTAELLARHGFALVDTESDPLVIGGATRGVVCPQRDVLAQVVVADVTLAQAAFDNGIGRAKNYGLGMLVVV